MQRFGDMDLIELIRSNTFPTTIIFLMSAVYQKNNLEHIAIETL